MGINIGIGVKAGSGSATSITTAAQTTQATGSTFVIVVAGGVGGGTLGTPTDSKSNTYIPINAAFTLNWGGTIRMWYCENATGGASHTFSGSQVAAGALEIYVAEIKGGLTSGILDQTTAWISDTVSPYTTNTTGTTAQANELALVFESTDTSATSSITWGNGYAVVPNSEETSSSLICGAFGYKILAATTTESGSITATNAVAGNGIVITLKDAIPGGGSPTIVPDYTKFPIKSLRYTNPRPLR